MRISFFLLKFCDQARKSSWKIIGGMIASIATTLSINLVYAATLPKENNNSCILSSIVVPLLGGSGDSPLIPVVIDGKPAAMYVSPAFDEIYVRDIGNIEFPYGTREATVIINGSHIERAQQSVISDLTIGEENLRNVDVVRLETPSTQSVSGRPIVGVLGRRALSRSIVMIDIPDRKFAFLRFQESGECKQPGPINQLVGQTVESVPLNGNFSVPIDFVGRTRLVELDPDLPHTTFPDSWLPKAQSHEGKEINKQTIARYDSFIDEGKLVTGYEMKLGSDMEKNQGIVFQEDMDNGAIGLPFFEGKVVFFDYLSQRLYFSDRKQQVELPVGRGLHFFHFATATASVDEREGRLP